MKISIVTPSYNQSSLLRVTLDSVLAQGIDDLEYLVIDGGSQDGSKDIIESYADRISYWCSEPDGGQYEAINKGIERSTGEVIAWLNSSDMYLPWTLKMVESIFKQYPQIDWISSLQCMRISENGLYDGIHRIPGFCGLSFYKGYYSGIGINHCIQQESTFWRRSLWDKIGGQIPSRFRYAGDFWLWSEFFKHAECIGVDAPFAAFRLHENQRGAGASYRVEVDAILDEFVKRGCGNNMSDSYEILTRDWADTSLTNNNRLPWKLNRYSLRDLEGSKLITGDYFSEVKYLSGKLNNIMGHLDVIQKSLIVKVAQRLNLCHKVDIKKDHMGL